MGTGDVLGVAIAALAQSSDPQLFLHFCDKSAFSLEKVGGCQREILNR